MGKANVLWISRPEDPSSVGSGVARNCGLEYVYISLLLRQARIFISNEWNLLVAVSSTLVTRIPFCSFSKMRFCFLRDRINSIMSRVYMTFMLTSLRARLNSFHLEKERGRWFPRGPVCFTDGKRIACLIWISRTGNYPHDLFRKVWKVVLL